MSPIWCIVKILLCNASKQTKCFENFKEPCWNNKIWVNDILSVFPIQNSKVLDIKVQYKSDHRLRSFFGLSDGVISFIYR